MSGALSGVSLPAEAYVLFDAILNDSSKDPELAKNNVRFLVEKTGGATHDEDNIFHVDTKQIYWDENGNRIGYDSARSLAKYMIYIGRPGTLIIHGKLDDALTHQEGIEQGAQYSLDHEGKTVAKGGALEPTVSQLLPESIYKVAVGQLLHSPPLHEDGLMISALFNR